MCSIILAIMSSMIFFLSFKDADCFFILNGGLSISMSLLSILFIIFGNYVNKNRFLLKKSEKKLCLVFSAILAFLWLLSASLIIDNTFNHILISKYNIIKSFVFFCGSYYVIYLFSMLILIYLNKGVNIKIKVIENICNFFDNHELCLCFLIFLCWFPLIIVSYPANIDWDGWHSITVYLGYWGATNFLHVFHMLFIGIFLSLGELIGNTSIGLYLCTIVQVIIYLFVILECYKLLCKLNTNFIIKFLLILMVCFSPYYSNFSSSLIKDGIYSIFLLWLVCKLIYFIEWPSKTYKDKNSIIKFFVASMGVLAFRKNGIHVYVVLAVFVIIFVIFNKNLKKYLRKTIIGFVVPIFLICIMSLIYTKTTNALRGSINEMLSLPYQQTARYLLYHSDEVTEKEKKVIGTVLLYDQLPKVYDPMISDPVKRSLPDEPRNTKDMLNYLVVWFKMFFKHPETYFAATFNQNYPLIYPMFGLKQTYFNYDPNYYPFVELNNQYINHKIEIEAPFKEGRRLISGFINLFFDFPIMAILTNISIFVLIALLFFLHMIISKNVKAMISIIPIIISIIIVILSPTISVMPRYAFPIYYLMPLVFCYYIYLLKLRGDKNG